MDYLNSEEKVVVAKSKVDSIKAESSKLSKDLIEATDQSTKAKKRVKELKEALKVEKKLVIQKGETIVEATDIVEGEGAATGGVTDEAQKDVGHVEEIASAP